MSKIEERRELARARERADLARLRFGNAVGDSLQRIAPERLKGDAIDLASEQFDEARRNLMARLRYWPVALGAASAGALALIFWKPARRLGSRGLKAAGLLWTTRKYWRRIL